jgi:hypothetical protein
MTEIQEAGRRAAANYRDGRGLEFDTFAKYATTDLAYNLERSGSKRRSAGATRQRQLRFARHREQTSGRSCLKRYTA